VKRKRERVHWKLFWSPKNRSVSFSGPASEPPKERVQVKRSPHVKRKGRKREKGKEKKKNKIDYLFQLSFLIEKLKKVKIGTNN
jgi:hypothetical protein